MDFNNVDFGNYDGATAGVIAGDRWEYPGIGYNATDGIFYVGEEQRKELAFVPFAIRQCKEVTDLTGAIHRYPIKTRREAMVDGDVTQRLQVVGLVDGELHIFGARSWTARAAWLNPRGGPYHDAKFAAGLWYRLEDYIKNVKASQGLATAPLCYELVLVPGEAMDLASAANAKQKSKGTPILCQSLKFVGAEAAKANETLFVEEDLQAWVDEWKAASTGDAQVEPAETPEAAVIELDGMPF